MTEKTYKVMGLAGGANIAIGIISIVVGVTTGIILLVSGGKLLGAKKNYIMLRLEMRIRYADEAM